MSPAERSVGKKEAKPGEAKTNMRPNPVDPDGGLAELPPDVEWCAERAAHALRWLAMHYPEAGGSEALHPPQEAAHEAAVSWPARGPRGVYPSRHGRGHTTRHSPGK